MQKNFLHRQVKKISDRKGQVQRGIVPSVFNGADRLPGDPDGLGKGSWLSPHCLRNSSTRFSIGASNRKASFTFTIAQGSRDVKVPLQFCWQAGGTGGAEAWRVSSSSSFLLQFPGGDGIV